MAKVRWQKAEGGLARVKGKEFTPEDGKSGGTHSVHASAHMLYMRHEALVYVYLCTLF